MCDCVQSSVIIAHGGAKSRKLGVIPCNYSKPLLGLLIGGRNCSVRKLNDIDGNKCAGFFRVSGMRENPFMNQRVCTSLGVFDSNGFGFSSELRLNEGGDEKFEVGLQNGEGKLRDFVGKNEADDNMVASRFKNKFGVSDFDLLQGGDAVNEVKKGGSKVEDLIGSGNGESEDLKEKLRLQPKRKQLITRSSMLAKQVIGIQSALNLGFVSQLWVDTNTWTVREVEVRPNLLSSELGKFILKDIGQVGDVVLIEDESLMLNEFRTVGLESLVGYNVVTPTRRNLGKVRGYTFNINSGAVESLELDAFGYSLIPSSLVSTYALFTEDVVEVISETIIVHEAAASHIQRLTKGFLGTKSMEMSSINHNYDEEEEYIQPVRGRKSRKKSSKRKFQPRTRDINDDLELPMDYM